MSEKEKKTVWVPEEWQHWVIEYFKENQVELKKLGVNTTNDLIWRLAELGKTDLDDQIIYVRNQRMTQTKHEKTE